MIAAQMCKNLALFAIQTAATNATVSARIDRSDFDYAQINVVAAPCSASNLSAKWAVLKVLESDTTTFPSTSTATISGFIGTTNTTAATTAGAVEFVIPLHQSSTADQVCRFNVDLRGRKKYVFLQLQPGASANTFRADANLFRGATAPVSTTQSGVAIVVNG